MITQCPIHLRSLSHSPPTWLRAHQARSRVLMRVLVKAGMHRSAIHRIDAEHVCVHVSAPARDGEANQALIRYLNKLLRAQCVVHAGHRSQWKWVKVEGAELSEVWNRVQSECAKGKE
jgi:uncharacterized protein (TIGR00251 family)